MVTYSRGSRNHWPCLAAILSQQRRTDAVRLASGASGWELLGCPLSLPGCSVPKRERKFPAEKPARFDYLSGVDIYQHRFWTL